MSKQKTNSTGDERLESIGTSLTKAEQFIEKNKKIIMYAIGGIALIILGVWGYNHYIHGPKVEKAADEMFAAQVYYEMDSLDLALNGDANNAGFLEILNNYRNTPSGNLAHYYLGMIYLKKGQFEDAIYELKKFNGKDDIVAPMALGCIGDAYLELGEKENAIKYYKKAYNKSDNLFTTPTYMMRAAWVYEDLGEWNKALKLYENIRDNYKKSFEGNEINKYIARANEMIHPEK